MSYESKAAVLQAGIVPETMLKELERWGLSVPPTIIEENQRLALENIREALESRELVEVRITDLDALRSYHERSRTGRLYFGAHRNGTKKTPTFVEVTFVRTAAGDYLIPWTHEDIYDLMLDDTTYLKPVGEPRVYFSDVSELYYGRRKFFMVCRPAPEEVKR
jgi:hypothetical protein